jgi:hypothetical protein
MSCYAASTDEYNGVEDYIVSMSIYWSGKDSSGKSISGSKVYNNINKKSASYSFSTNCSAKYYFEATMNVASKNSSRSTTCAHNPNWSNTSSDSSSNHNYKVDVEAQEVNGVLNIGAWDYGSVPDMSGTFKSFSITWNGYDSNGKSISGTGSPSISQKSKTYMEGSLSTKLDFQYYGNATGTLVTTHGTYTNKTSWGSKNPTTSSGSNTGSSLSITSFVIDDANTTGMKNGKYVIGTKLKLKVTVKSTYGTKSVRFILTGAKESDNSWNVPYQTTITADSTAVATGVIHMKCIVTDYKGNTASKTLDVTIYGEGDSYYAYYFFNNYIQDHCKNDVAAVNIIFYNVYNVMKDQYDPRKKTIQCYGHNYKTYNDLKNKKHKDSDLTFLTSFVIPDEKNVSKTIVTLTENEIKKIKSFKGLAFKIQNKDALTVHDIKCEIEFIYK